MRDFFWAIAAALLSVLRLTAITMPTGASRLKVRGWRRRPGKIKWDAVNSNSWRAVIGARFNGLFVRRPL